MLCVANIGPGRAKNADKVKAGMLEEALIFRREDGMDERRRQVLVTHRAPLFALTVEKIGNELRLNLRRSEVCAAVQRPNAANHLAVELDGNRVAPAKVGKL